MENRNTAPLFLTLLFLPLLLGAQPREGGVPVDRRDRMANVSVTIEVDSGEREVVGTTSVVRRYEVVATADGAGSRLSSGARVPIPVTTKGVGEGPNSVVQSIQYQDVGFSAEIRVELVGENRYLVDARIEDSLLQDPEGANSHPVIHHHTYRVRGTLALGETLLASSNSAQKYRVILGLEAVASGR